MLDRAAVHDQCVGEWKVHMLCLNALHSMSTAISFEMVFHNC
jgi:hypothetical protein